MCESCQSTLCYHGCPFYEETAIPTLCSCCHEAISPGDLRYEREGQALCECCAESLTIDDLIDLCDLREIGELLGQFGYRRV